WIILQMVGKQSNRSGIGARATVTTRNRSQIDEVRSGGSYLSQNDLRLHFGLGEAVVVDRIEVAWPSGRREAFVQVKANRVGALHEGSGQLVPKGAGAKP